MNFCKTFLNKPSTRKALCKSFKPMISTIIKRLGNTKKLDKKRVEVVTSNLLKTSLESFDKSFLESCSKGCKEFENTPHPCGPENEKIMLKNIQKFKSHEIQNNFKLIDFYNSQSKLINQSRKKSRKSR